MMRFMFAVAVAALIAATGRTGETPVGAPLPTTPLVIGAATDERVAAAPARRGLFGRLRNRNAAPTARPAPLVTTPGTIITAPPVLAPTPMPPVAPQQMPTAKPTR